MLAIVQRLVLSFTLAVLTGCSLAPTKPGAGVMPQGVDDGIERMWWAVRFRVYWLPLEQPDWAVDHLLAHAVIAPVLEHHGQHIPLWRFHRRAAPDAGGHQFSFLFYTDAATANRLRRAVREDPLTREMLASGFVERLLLDAHGYPGREQVQATSDTQWAPEMQRQWPVYIMGVSALWLGLIDEYLPPGEADEAAAEKLTRYRQAALRITALWQTEGRHALLHHLAAIFGYAPLMIGGEPRRL